jgi:N-acetylmuramoyl-L-alanine amidase
VNNQSYFRSATSRRGPLRLLLPLFLLLAVLDAGSAADQKRLAIYSTVANYRIAVTEHDGRDYVGLLEVLDPLGSVTVLSQPSRWTLRYNDVPVEFVPGKSTVRIRGRDFEIAAPMLLENGHGLVSLSSLSSLLPRILGGPVTFHEASRRLFIGTVAVHFTAQIAKLDPPTLVMNFSAPVNPMISTEPSKVLMAFTRDPLVAPGTQSLSFGNKAISSAVYDENNGAALITINGTGSLFASFSNGGRTITVTAATPGRPAAAVAQQTIPAPAGVTPPPLPAPGAVLPPPVPPVPVKYFAVIDASHGGTERGAALSDSLAEKDVTLDFARRLKQDLQSQGINTLLLRDGDTALTLDQRAAFANHSRPAIYICVHASSEGGGVRVYSALIPSGGINSGVFVDWNTAQTDSLPISRAFVTALGSELQKKRLSVRMLVAPLRPLNNITRPAIAIELGPPGTGIADLNSPGYHELVASSVTLAILSMRSQLESGR